MKFVSLDGETGEIRTPPETRVLCFVLELSGRQVKGVIPLNILGGIRGLLFVKKEKPPRFLGGLA